MNPQAEISLDVILAAFAGTAVVWAWLAGRWRRRLPLLRYEPRRRVPWQGWDVLLVALFYLLALDAAGRIVATVLGPERIEPLPQAAAAAGAEHPAPVHPLVQLVRHGNAWMLLAAGVVAVVVAPIAEEFLFRVLLQGTLAAAERRRRRILPALRLLPAGALPIALSSLVFAAMHIRTGDKKYCLEYLFAMLAGQAAVNVLTMVVAVAWVRIRVGATARDLGWVSDRLPSDLRLGLVAFAAVAVPIYAIQVGLMMLLPRGMAADPFSLFFFALVLGLLYYRTHRIVPGIVLHMSLNATSLLWLAWQTGMQ
jgi:membrane protease YdiL (CAAX protease family)